MFELVKKVEKSSLKTLFFKLQSRLIYCNAASNQGSLIPSMPCLSAGIFVSIKQDLFEGFCKKILIQPLTYGIDNLL